MFNLSKKTGLIAVLIVILAAGVLGYGYQQKASAKRTFFGDGYIMEVGTSTDKVQPKPVYFQAGTAYRLQYPGAVAFKSMGGKKESLPADSFLHFADGSISSLTDGVALELQELKDGLVNYYNIKNDSVMKKQEGGYLLDNKGTSIPFTGFVWKLSDHKFLVSSDQVTIGLPNGETPKIAGYVEVNYIDDGVVQMVSDDAAYQVLSSGTTITFGNGMGIDIGSRMVLEDGKEKMSLDGMTPQGETNITVAPSQDLDLKVPKFDITTIDGRKGDGGDDGEKGTEGVRGDAGETGTDGDNGTSGENGKNGSTGSSGNSGSSGSSGSTGSTGANGASGKAGGTGGTGGSGSESQTIVMPSVTLSEFTYTTTTVQGTVAAGEGQNVTLGDGVMAILDLSTGKAVFTYELGNLDSMPTSEFSYSQLEPDKEYRLKVTAHYELTIDLDDGTAPSGDREFISRVFSTSSYGIAESYHYAAVNRLVLQVEKKGYSNVQSATVTLIAEDGSEDSRELSFAGGETRVPVEFGNLKPNASYKVKLEIVGDNGRETVSTHEYKTLKTPPSIGGAPVVAINPRGYFEFRPSISDLNPFLDEHNGIQSYRYEVYTARETNRTLQASVSAKDTSAVAAYIDGVNLRRNTYYVSRLVVEFFDNEKAVEYATPYSEEFIMEESSGAPYITFTDISAVTGGASGVNFESITGNLKFFANFADLDTTSSLRVTLYSEAFYHESDIVAFKTEDLSADGYFDKKIELKGLRKNTTYRFNVYGRYRGDINESILATCVVTTPETDTVKVSMASAENVKEGIAADVYFTDDKEQALAPRAATTVRQMVVSLQDSTTKYTTVPLTFKFSDTAPYYSSEFVNYFGQDNIYRITNEMLGVPTSSLKDNTNYTISIDAVYDYTVEDDYRYEGSVNTYKNLIKLGGMTKCTVRKQLTAPSLPETPLKIQNIENSQLSQFGFEKVKELSDTAVVGMVLTPNYDNSSQFATSVNYYVYDTKQYDKWVGAIPDDESKNDPLSRNAGHAVLKYNYDLKSVVPGKDGLLPKLIVFLADVDTQGITEGDISANSSALSDWKGIRFIRSDTYKPMENTGSDMLDRGKYYMAAYDLVLNINGNTDYRYPYDYESNIGQGYAGVGQILRGETKIPRMEPELAIYPYAMDTREKTASWKVKAVKDPDHAMTTESFILASGKNTYPSASLDGIEEDQVYDKLTAGFTEIAFDRTQVAGALAGDMLTFKVRYNAYWENDDAETVDKLLVTQSFKTAPDGMAENIGKFTDLSAVKDSTQNAVVFTIAMKPGISQTDFIKYMDQASALYVKVEGKEEFYLKLPKGSNGSFYTAALPLSEISQYAGMTIGLEGKVLFEDAQYGYSYSSAPDAKKRYAIQDQAGNFYIPDVTTGGLKTISVPGESVYAVDKGAQITDEGISFAHKSAMLGSSYFATMNLSLGESGAIWPGAKVMGTSIVLKPLTTAAGPGWDSLSVAFDSMIPVISNVNQQAGLKTVQVTMTITKNIESLIEETVENQLKSQYVYIRLDKKNEAGVFKEVKTIAVPLEQLVVDKGSGKASYKFEGLEKSSTYRAAFMGVLKGASGEAKTVFRDLNGKETYIEMNTMDSVNAAFSNMRYYNNYYNNKYLIYVHTLDTLDNIKLRYRLDEADADGSLIPVYTHQEMVNQGIITLPDTLSLDSNIVRLICSPPSKVQFGHKYRMTVEIYTSDADFENMTPEELEKEKVGENTSRDLSLAAVNQPSAKVTYTLTPAMGGGKEDYSKQRMSVAVNISDSSKIIATDNRAEYEFTGVTGTVKKVLDKDGNELTTVDGQPDLGALQGCYMIRLEARQYMSVGDSDIPLDTWKPLPEANITLPQGVGSYDDFVMYGWRGIYLKDLEPSKEYRISIYASVNSELKGGIGTISKEMIDSGQAVKVGQYVLNTADGKGIYIDNSKTVFSQESADTVAVTLTNPSGLERVKYMRCDFISEDNVADYGVYSGLMTIGEGPENDAVMTSVVSESGITKVTIRFKASFKVAGDYYVNMRLYGAGKPGSDVEAEDNILFSSLSERLFPITLVQASASNPVPAVPYMEKAVAWEEKRNRLYSRNSYENRNKLKNIDSFEYRNCERRPS